LEPILFLALSGVEIKLTDIPPSPCRIMKILPSAICPVLLFSVLLCEYGFAQSTNIPPAGPAATPSAVSSPAPPISPIAFDDRFTAISEDETPEPVLRFTYRLWPAADVSETVVESGGQAIASTTNAYAENPLNKSALLVLVDTSVGQAQLPRSRTIEQNKKAIEELANLVTPRIGLGVYGFANDLVEIAPLGSTPSQVRASLPRIRAEGLGTRVALSARDAIGKLAAFPAKRKALVIFTDGKDEDTGYNWQDFRDAAQQAGIMIFAVGCPESPVDVPGLGALQRLAEDTKGFYAQMTLPAGPGRGAPQNPPGLAKAMLDSLDQGGDVVASLSGQPADATITVRLKTESGQTLEKELNRSVRAASPTPSESPGPSVSASPGPQTGASASTARPAGKKWWEALLDEKNRLWLIVGGAGLLFLGLLLLRALVKKRDIQSVDIERVDLSEDSTTRNASPSARGAALAYLVLQDADATRMPLSKTATRIGRRSDNDIVFSNDSVSGHHAEVHMGRDGSFTITDLNSGNGVYVNGSKVQQSGLRDGDSVELGEVRFRFSIAG
jgi:hypothetical protein